jgi:signal transduction histidine kinase
MTDGSDTDVPADAAGTDSSDSPARWSVGRFIRRNYWAKFVIAVAVIFLVITTAGTATYLQVQEEIRDDTESQLTSRATLQSQSLSNWVQRMRTRTRTISATGALSSSDLDRNHLFQSLSRSALDVRGAHVVNHSSQTIVVSNVHSYDGTSTASIDAPWTELSLNTGPAYEDAVWTTNATYQPAYTDSQVLAFVTQVPNTQDRLLVVVAEFPQSTQDRGSTIVLDAGSGTLVHAPATAAVDPDAYEDPTALATLQSGRNAFVQTTPDVVRAYALVEQANWVVVTSLPTAEAFALSRTVGRNLLILIGSGLFSLIAVSFVLGRQTVVPLVALRKKAEQMERGDLSVTLTTDRVDEIGQLFVAFANMRDSLRTKIEKLKLREQREARLREENDRLQEFASLVCHDLRNPLEVAEGHIDLERERSDSHHLQVVADEHERIREIISEMLEMSRHGRTVRDVDVVPLESLVTEAWSNVETETLELQLECDHLITCDPKRVLSLFENLFRNAVEHAGPESTVRVGSFAGGFYVEDDGPGIDEADRDKIFEAGFTTDEEGTGYGLLLVSEICGAHDWEITVEDGIEQDATVESGSTNLTTESQVGARFTVTGVETKPDE